MQGFFASKDKLIWECSNRTKDEVKKQVLKGLNLINQLLKTNYRISQIHFAPIDSCANKVYVAELIRHYYTGKEFIQLKQKVYRKCIKIKYYLYK